MITNSTLVIIAVIAALGLVTAIAVDIMLTAQEAEATRGPEVECFEPLNG
jgi:hypothetical protein